MELRFARRMSILKASEIREILKITQRPEVISFAGGLPAPEFFPVDAIAEAARRVLEREGRKALQYSTTEGFPPLRQWIAERMNSRWNTALSDEDILVTVGSQQGLDLTGKLFLDEGDAVVCESPTYLGAISAFNVFRPRWVEVPTDEAGMDMAALENVLATEPRVKFIYVVPNFQNPSGRTWSEARREALYQLAERFDVPIIEDNPYGELRFEGVAPNSIQSRDGAGRVISLGTLSKVFCPGLRLGWVAAPRRILEKYVVLKQGTDLHTSSLDQMIAAEYLTQNDLDAAIGRIGAAYRSRRDAMIGALAAEMPPGVCFSRPEGGLFLWVEFPPNFDARRLLLKCLEFDVAFVPGGAFFPNGNRENACRLNFSAMPEPRIVEGIRRLAAAVRQMLTEAAA